MISRIENGSGGRYLYIQQEAEDNGFEFKMAASLVSDCIIAPAQVYAHGDLCHEYCITGLKELEEYLSGISLHSGDIIRLLAQTEQSVNTVKNYLLSEADLLINTDYIYVDAEKGLLKLCIVPGYNGDFEQGLKAFISRLLVHIDAADDAALRLGFRLFKIISQAEFKLHDIISALRAPEARAAEISIGPDSAEAYELDIDKLGQKLQYDGAPFYDAQSTQPYTPLRHTAEPADTVAGINEATAGNEYRDNVYTGRRQDYNESGSAYDTQDNEPDTEAKPRNILKDTLGGLIVSQGILIAVAAAVFLLKGRAAVMRLIPIYLIIAACVTVYYVISFILKKRQAANAF